MVSSPSGGDYSEPPSKPAPPSNMIAPQGSSAAFNPHFISFLGDTNTPSTGLTPQMLAEIAASNGPAASSTASTATSTPAAATANPDRQKLAAMMMQLQQPASKGYGIRGSGGSGGLY